MVTLVTKEQDKDDSKFHIRNKTDEKTMDHCLLTSERKKPSI